MDEFEKALIEAQDQRSEEWRDIRAGRFTASEFHVLLGKSDTKWTDGAETYIHTKVAEQITGLVPESPRTAPIAWGEDNEEGARHLYHEITGTKITKAGFHVYGDHGGGSPDGLIGDDAFLEIKCPFNSANHIDFLKLEKGSEIKIANPKYYTQCQANMVFTGRKLCIFTSFDPRFPIQKQKIKILEMAPDNELQDLIKARLERAIETKLEIVKALS